MKHRLLLSLVIIGSMVIFTGCFGVDAEFKAIRNMTLNECGRSFVTDKEFSLGSFELWLAEALVGMSDDDVAENILDNLSGVQIGMYKRRDNNNIPARSLFTKIDRKLSKKGLHHIVKSYGKNKMEVVYINESEDKMLNELYIIKLDEKELSIVQVTGDLNEVIETAIREEGFDIRDDFNSITQQ